MKIGENYKPVGLLRFRRLMADIPVMTQKRKIL